MTRQQMQGIGQQQLLVLLLVVQTQFNQGQGLRVQACGMAQKVLHRCIDVLAKRHHLIQARACEQAAFWSGMARPQCFVIGVEQKRKCLIKDLIVLRKRLENQAFKEPTGVGQVPFGGAGVWHGLNTLVLGAQWRGQLQRVMTQFGVTSK